jgi:hypothetical protein
MPPVPVNAETYTPSAAIIPSSGMYTSLYPAGNAPVNSVPPPFPLVSVKVEAAVA